jgi:hypothetical protein
MRAQRGEAMNDKIRALSCVGWILGCFAACKPAPAELSRMTSNHHPSEPAVAPVEPASHVGEASALPPIDSTYRLPQRRGESPGVSDSPPGTMLAHRQLTQTSPSSLQELLFARGAALPDIHVEPSGISVPGARAFVLSGTAALGPADAFQVGTEFAHIHPLEDGSLHMKLPPSVARAAFERGWGVPHPRSGTPLIYGPRDAEELAVTWQLLLRSYVWAREGRVVDLQT